MFFLHTDLLFFPNEIMFACILIAVTIIASAIIHSCLITLGLAAVALLISYKNAWSVTSEIIHNTTSDKLNYIDKHFLLS